jgi:hypothetical protein
MTDAAMADLDLNLLGSQRTGIVFMGFERLTFPERGVSFDFGGHSGGKKMLNEGNKNAGPTWL